MDEVLDDHGDSVAEEAFQDFTAQTIIQGSETLFTSYLKNDSEYVSKFLGLLLEIRGCFTGYLLKWKGVSLTHSTG